eukprot:3448075-Prymnesium_polylepis.3
MKTQIPCIAAEKPKNNQVTTAMLKNWTFAGTTSKTYPSGPIDSHDGFTLKILTVMLLSPATTTAAMANERCMAKHTKWANHSQRSRRISILHCLKQINARPHRESEQSVDKEQQQQQPNKYKLAIARLTDVTVLAFFVCCEAGSPMSACSREMARFPNVNPLAGAEGVSLAMLGPTALL